MSISGRASEIKTTNTVLVMGKNLIMLEKCRVFPFDSKSWKKRPSHFFVKVKPRAKVVAFNPLECRGKVVLNGSLILITFELKLRTEFLESFTTGTVVMT